MVNLKEAKKEQVETTPVTVRVPTKYLNALKKFNVRKTDFILQAFKETFPEL